MSEVPALVHNGLSRYGNETNPSSQPAASSQRENQSLHYLAAKQKTYPNCRAFSVIINKQTKGLNPDRAAAQPPHPYTKEQDRINL